MSLRLRYVCLLMMVLCSISCEKEEVQKRFQELNWITVEQSRMPLLFTGNKESNTILLVIHGGPGNSSLDYLGLFERYFGQDYLLAFWDQRYSGFSRFNFTLSMTMESNISDGNLIVSELRKQFPNKKIVLWGHHWGGAVVMGLATHPTFKNTIDGWVIVNGMVSGYEYFRSRWQFALRRSNELLSRGQLAYADTVRLLQRLEPIAGRWNQTSQARIDGIASRLLFSGEPNTARELETFNASQVRDVFPLQRERDKARLNVFQNPNSISFSRTLYVWQPSLNEINKPGLLIWGTKDEKCTLELLQWATTEFTNRQKSVSVQRYEEGWDTPFFSQPEKHAADVKAFLQSIK